MSKRKLEAAKEIHIAKKGASKDLMALPKALQPQKKEEELQGQKQRTLVFANRGISGEGRHLMSDLRTLIPNCKKESKLDATLPLHTINETCYVYSCNNCIFFEQRGTALYMWVSKAPKGPSVKFHIKNSM